MIENARNIVVGDVVKYVDYPYDVIKAEVIDDYYTEDDAVHYFILQELNTNREISIKAIKLYNNGSEIIKKVEEPMRTALTRWKRTRHRLARMGLTKDK